LNTQYLKFKLSTQPLIHFSAWTTLQPIQDPTWPSLLTYIAYVHNTHMSGHYSI